MNKIRYFTLIFCGLLVLHGPLLSQQYIADYTVAKEEVLRNIPVEYINKAKAELVVAYQHTSHGTHVSRGMFGLPTYKTGDSLFGLSRVHAEHLLEFRDFALEDYAPPGVEATDLSRDVETAFIQTTRNYLDAPENATVNVVMWAWSRIADHDVEGNYMPGMDSLISEYGPGGSKIGSGEGQREVSVTFIYMTGHAIKDENTGPLNPKPQAQLIIDTCIANQMFCLDYYSIDTRTMANVYYEDTGDNGDSDTYGGNFYQDWQDAHTLGEHYYENWHTMEGHVTYGEHTTQHITSNRKAYAMWWILARIAGWDGMLPITSIQIISPNDTTSVMTGDSLQLSAIVLHDIATNPAVAWTVINGSGSATISAKGMLRGGLPGDVEVLATALDGSGVADTMALTILDPLMPVTSITVATEGGVTVIDEGTTLQCSATVLPVDATNAEVAWSVISGTGSASIDSEGLLTALTAGTAWVVATATDGSGVSDTLLLNIDAAIILLTEISIISVSGDSVVEVGNTLQFTALVSPANASNPLVDWSIVNGTGTATICDCATLTALAPGTVDVVATARDASGVSSSFAVTINGPSALFDKRDASSILLYPNPSTGKVYLNAEDLPVERIKVISSGGSVVLELAPDPGERLIELDLSDRQPGVFFIHAFSKDFSSIFRIIIAR